VLTGKHIVVIANGAMDDYDYFKQVLIKADYIIAADGGLKHLDKMDVSPTLMLGDFDSIESIAYYKERFPEAEVKTFEIRKDYTDSELAVRIAIDYKPSKVTLLGVTGSRLDHTMANVTLLKLIYDAGIEGLIVNEHNTVRYSEASMKLGGEIGTNMSIVPLSEEVSGITLSGFEYPLFEATLAFGSTTGISNVFAEEQAEVKIRSGRMLVLQSRD